MMITITKEGDANVEYFSYELNKIETEDEVNQTK